MLRVGENDKGIACADSNTTRRKGNLVKMWQFYDYTYERIRLLMAAFSQDKWEAVPWFIPNHSKTSGHQLHQKALVKVCGDLRAVRRDLATAATLN